ncbi:MAG: hypothetical protein ACXU82_00090 [Caulobacteraceae bacterium]
MRRGGSLWLAAMALAAVAIAACEGGPRPGHVQDEAQAAGRTEASFPHSAVDYFHDMDGGLALNQTEVQGRNMWVVWSGGNDRFWDVMTQKTFGAFDLLKIITSYPDPKVQAFHREDRWAYLGLVNEPCFDEAKAPDPDRFGLYLDVRRGDCKADPFADEKAYPGVKTGFRGHAFAADTRLADGSKPPAAMPVGSYYGWPTGVVGLRLFPNPAFDDAAARRWDPKRYYTDPAYYNDPTLVRPYRVGMSCGFCHVGPSPSHAPADPEHPAFADLSSTVGAQYMWVDRLFVHNADQKNFMFQLVHTYRPGAMDTSLVSTDMINNPRTMNAIYNLDDRMGVNATPQLPGGALYLGKETIKGGEQNNKQFNQYISSGPLTQFYTAPDKVLTPRVLKDGSDAVGALGALNRVYLNIGLFSEEWLLHFNAVVGGKEISPIPIATAEKNSAYWRATEAGTPATALFFLKAGRPDRLASIPGGAVFLNDGADTVARGKQVFAETCARCHSSKLPPDAVALLSPDKCEGPGYLDCFKAYWRNSQSTAFKQQMRAIVEAPDFLDHNYLSADFRVPNTLLRTNACSPLATNALRGNIWDNFSSDTYKRLPSVGTITVTDPFTGEPRPYAMPAGGRGYTRPPSLISLWSSAPYLLNNTVGPFSYRKGDANGYAYEASPMVGVSDRMGVFQPAIEQMLWPEKRQADSVLGAKAGGLIDRTSETSWIVVAPAFVPGALRPASGLLKPFYPWLVYDPADKARLARDLPGYPNLPDNMKGSIVLGPIPAGMPVNLLANTKLRAETGNPIDNLVNTWRLLRLAHRLSHDLKDLPPGLTGMALRDHFANVREPLLQLSKCPDFVVNRGHLFGAEAFNQQDGLSADERAWGTETPLSDPDKRALIAFLKTF